MDMKVNEEAREALWNSVRDVHHERFNQKPAADEWSIKQILEHLYLMEGAIANNIEKQLASGKEEEAKKRPIELSVDRTTKVEAPNEFQPTDDEASILEMEEKLATSHQALQKIANEYNEATLAKKSMPHPAFGNMSLDQWVTFVGYHEERHTKQIEEVKEKLGL